MNAGEEYSLDIEEQFSRSGIDIYSFYLERSNEDVISVEGNKLKAKNSGKAIIDVVLYERSTSTCYFTTSANVYVINESTMIEIWTAEDLVNINNNLSGHYILKSDIDLSAYPVWIPIAAGINNYFTGMFVNPDGYVFKNLTIPFYKDFSKVGPADCKVVVDAYIME